MTLCPFGPQKMLVDKRLPHSSYNTVNGLWHTVAVCASYF